MMANQSLMRQFLPNRFIPIDNPLPREMPNAQAWRDAKSGMHIIETREDYDGRDWYHVSMSHTDRLPSYDEMQLVRVCFIGEAHTALQIFPPKSQYVDHHHYCLHLYVCLTNDIVPDGLLPR